MVKAKLREKFTTRSTFFIQLECSCVFGASTAYFSLRSSDDPYYNKLISHINKEVIYKGYDEDGYEVITLKPGPDGQAVLDETNVPDASRIYTRPYTLKLKPYHKDVEFLNEDEVTIQIFGKLPPPDLVTGLVSMREPVISQYDPIIFDVLLIYKPTGEYVQLTRQYGEYVFYAEPVKPGIEGDEYFAFRVLRFLPEKWNRVAATVHTLWDNVTVTRQIRFHYLGRPLRFLETDTDLSIEFRQRKG